MGTIRSLHITMGLPGSGKTTYARQVVPHAMEQLNRNLFWKGIAAQSGETYICLDEVGKNLFKEQLTLFSSLEETINHVVNVYVITYGDVYLDGLFLTNDEVRYAINAFAAKHTIREISLHHWRENRQSCLVNDFNRRDVDSQYTIRNAKLEVPHEVLLKEEFPQITFVYHDVEECPSCIRAFEQFGAIVRNKYTLESSPWTDDADAEFEELYSLLEKICPKLTFIQFRKIQKECVEVKSKYISDYYDSHTEYRFVCDLKKLAEELKSIGYELNPEGPQ